MGKNTSIIWFILYLLVQFQTACNIQRPCEEPTEFPILAGFYFKTDSLNIDTALVDLSIYARGREDSLLYDRDSVNHIVLPLNPFSDTTQFIFWAGADTDTITFYYYRFLKMASPECGFAMNFIISSFTNSKSFIDSVSLTDPTLDANKEEHLQIFVH